MFYLKLAWNNLKKSLNVFAPFVLATLVLYTLVCSTLLLLLSPMSNKMSYGGIALGLAVIVLVIFSLIMALYSYNFLLKQRSREFGLYNILGMNKKQVSLLATIELCLIFLVVIILGSLLSAVFANFLYLIFVNLVSYAKLDFTIVPLAFIIATFILAAIFLVLEISGLRKISVTSPLILFRTQERAEKEPKGNALFAFLGVIFLGVGYYLSFSSSKLPALAVLYLFFAAILLVIAGTYLFYISFTTWYLKRRRRNKAYYYQAEHFVTTSQMIFRMKQNAVGLANITLLAIMAFVTIALTTSLYSGSLTISHSIFPKNTRIDFDAKTKAEGEALFKQTTAKLDQSPTDVTSYFSVLVSVSYDNSKNWTISKKDVVKPKLSTTAFAYLITQDDFRALGNSLPQLKDNQTALFVQKGNSTAKTINFLGTKFDNRKNFKAIKMPDSLNTYNVAVLVVSNEQVLTQLTDAYNRLEGNRFEAKPHFSSFINLSQKEQTTLSNHLNAYNKKTDKNFAILETRRNFEQDIFSFYGGFLFTGFLLGISFLLGAALIIYYKQYTEGNEDKKSYKILQEVGMSQQTVRKTINSQIILVFFMPLLVAIIHFLAALPILRQIMYLFGLTSSQHVYTVSAIVIAGVILIYFFIYRVTSRIYYNIIER